MREAVMPVPTKAWALKRVSQVLAAGARERLRPRSSLGALDVPRSAEAIDARWLTAALCSEAPGARVISVAAMDGSAGTTSRGSLEVAYNDAGIEARLPTRLFAKCTTTLGQRLMLGLGGLIHGEPGFYAHVRPLLDIEAPAGYFGAVDDRSWRSVVLIEDVAHSKGARFIDPRAGLTRAQVEDLLSNVASWHGALWSSPRLAQWRWLKTPADQMKVIDALISVADRRRAGAKRASAVIPPALRARQADLYAGMRESMRIASRGPETYLHGDLHVANAYLTREGAVGVCDWQVGLRGSWVHDYAYIVMTALAIEDRRAIECELLDFYLDRLAASGGQRIGREDAFLAYRRATLYPYFAWIYTIGRSMLQPQFQPRDVSLQMVGRISAAIDDLDSLAAVGL